MLRKGSIIVFAMLALAASVNSSQPASIASTAQVAAAQTTPAQAPTLALGEVFAGNGFSFVIEDVFTEASPDVVGFSEVRASVSLRNDSDQFLLFSYGAFAGDPLYPDLRLKDSTGDLHAPDSGHPARSVAPRADLNVIEPGLAARWTMGFHVPTVSANSMAIELVFGGAILASWDLDTSGGAVDWGAPQMTSISLGDAVAWADGVTVTPKEIGSRMCGDPTIEPVAHIFTLAFEVTNDNNVLTDWPGVNEPNVPAIAQWSDGSAADAVLETYVGAAETLGRIGGRGVHFPPGHTADRALMFAAPRDGRLADLETLPAGVLLIPPSGERLWVDLTGVDATIGVSSSFCDLGFAVGPMPYAFTPPAKFQVRGETGLSDPAGQDAAAKDLIARALAVVGLYYDGAGQTFENVTSEALEAVETSIDFASHTAEVDLDETDDHTGKLYFDTDEENGNFIYLVTQSESGSWFCAGIDAYITPLDGSGTTSLGAAETCFTNAFVEEDAETGGGS